MNRRMLLVLMLVTVIASLIVGCMPSPEPVIATESEASKVEEKTVVMEDDDDDADDDDMEMEDEDDEEEEEDEDMDEEPAPSLATATAVTMLANQPGRAIVSARGNHFVVDSVPPLAGPNEELNPFDMLLAALGTCGIFIYEKAAVELDIPLDAVAAYVEADFNPAGVKDGSVNPRVQAFRVYMEMTGPSDEQAEVLAEEFRTRCPIYTTLIRSAPIEITSDGMGEGPVAEGLATAKAVAMLSNQPGRAIVSARGNHFVIDSVPPLEGPNEERNPLDMILGALGTCGTFVFEKASEEQGFGLSAITTTVEGDFNPAGVKDGSVNPRIQTFRVMMDLKGVTPDQAEVLEDEFTSRCPIYTTLERSADIEIMLTVD